MLKNRRKRKKKSNSNTKFLRVSQVKFWLYQFHYHKYGTGALLQRILKDREN